MNISVSKIHVSVQKRKAFFVFAFFELFFSFPILLFENVELPWTKAVLAVLIYLGLFFIPFTLMMFGRVKKSAVVIRIGLDTLFLIIHGNVTEIDWSNVKCVKINEKIFTGKYSRIAGITVETNLPSGAFMKTTRDFFIPDMFDISKEELARQILEHVKGSK